MRILFPINEAYPLYKIGGLGDVGGSLPRYLGSLNLDVRLALPLHPEIVLDSSWIPLSRFTLSYDRQPLLINVFQGFLPGTSVPLYFFAENRYLSLSTDASDNHADKYAVFSLAVSHWLTHHSPSWQPHLIHAHDWHTALIPVFLKHLYQPNAIKTILTIHNLAFQGSTTTPILKKTGLQPHCCQIIDWDQLDGDLNLLLQGLLHSDYITTVSPTYAREILTPRYGQNLHLILNQRKSRLQGILNGLDLQIFNPQTDPHLYHPYSVTNALEQKLKNKQALYSQLGLSHDYHLPLIVFVGRVDPQQKGIDLIIKTLQSGLLPPDGSIFIFLGTGDHGYEQTLHRLADHSRVHVFTRYDEALARQLYAASQITLIPSLFEPCGLVQLIAMRYGSLPVARQTGGLTDTIKSLYNGFLFKDYTSKNMHQTLTQALSAVNDPRLYPRLVNQAMNTQFTWNQSALVYRRLYRQILTS